MAKKKTTEEKIITLTADEALKVLLPHKEGRKQRVHSFMGGGPFVMGCDIDLTSVKKQLKESSSIVFAGPNMRGMGHGIAYLDKNEVYIFLETEGSKLSALEKEKS